MPGLEARELSLPMRSDAMPCKEDHVLPHKPAAKFDGVTWDPSRLGTPRKRLVLRDRSGSLSDRVGREGCLFGIGEGFLEDEDDTGGPSSQLGDFVGLENVSSSSSLVRRRLRGRRVVELLTEAVEDGGRSTFMAVTANLGFVKKVTCGLGGYTQAH